MKNIHTEVEVNAASDQVWNFFLNFENHKNWNPFFQSIVKSDDGLNIHSQIGKFTAKILENTSDGCLTWEGRLGNSDLFFVGRHSFMVKKTSDNKSVFVNSEKFKGMLIPFIRNKLFLWIATSALRASSRRRGFVDIFGVIARNEVTWQSRKIVTYLLGLVLYLSCGPLFAIR